MPLLQARGQDERTESLLKKINKNHKRRVYFWEQTCGIRTGTWGWHCRALFVLPQIQQSLRAFSGHKIILCKIKSWFSPNFQHFEPLSGIWKRISSPASSNSHRKRNIWSWARFQEMQHTASLSSTAVTGPGKEDLVERDARRIPGPAPVSSHPFAPNKNPMLSTQLSAFLSGWNPRAAAAHCTHTQRWTLCWHNYPLIWAIPIKDLCSFSCHKLRLFLLEFRAPSRCCFPHWAVPVSPCCCSIT